MGCVCTFLATSASTLFLAASTTNEDTTPNEELLLNETQDAGADNPATPNDNNNNDTNTQTTSNPVESAPPTLTTHATGPPHDLPNNNNKINNINKNASDTPDTHDSNDSNESNESNDSTEFAPKSSPAPHALDKGLFHKFETNSATYVILGYEMGSSHALDAPYLRKPSQIYSKTLSSQLNLLHSSSHASHTPRTGQQARPHAPIVNFVRSIPLLPSLFELCYILAPHLSQTSANTKNVPETSQSSKTSKTAKTIKFCKKTLSNLVNSPRGRLGIDSDASETVTKVVYASHPLHAACSEDVALLIAQFCYYPNESYFYNEIRVLDHCCKKSFPGLNIIYEILEIIVLEYVGAIAWNDEFMDEIDNYNELKQRLHRVRSVQQSRKRFQTPLQPCTRNNSINSINSNTSNNCINPFDDISDNSDIADDSDESEAFETFEDNEDSKLQELEELHELNALDGIRNIRTYTNYQSYRQRTREYSNEAIRMRSMRQAKLSKKVKKYVKMGGTQNVLNEKEAFMYAVFDECSKMSEKEMKQREVAWQQFMRYHEPPSVRHSQVRIGRDGRDLRGIVWPEDDAFLWKSRIAIIQAKIRRKLLSQQSQLAQQSEVENNGMKWKSEKMKEMFENEEEKRLFEEKIEKLAILEAWEMNEKWMQKDWVYNNYLKSQLKFDKFKNVVEFARPRNDFINLKSQFAIQKNCKMLINCKILGKSDEMWVGFVHKSCYTQKGMIERSKGSLMYYGGREGKISSEAPVDNYNKFDTGTGAIHGFGEVLTKQSDHFEVYQKNDWISFFINTNVDEQCLKIYKNGKFIYQTNRLPITLESDDTKEDITQNRSQFSGFQFGSLNWFDTTSASVSASTNSTSVSNASNDGNSDGNADEKQQRGEEMKSNSGKEKQINESMNDLSCDIGDSALYFCAVVDEPNDGFLIEQVMISDEFE